MSAEERGGSISCRSMTEIARLGGGNDWTGSELVDRERTSRRLIQFGTELRLAFLSLRNYIVLRGSVWIVPKRRP